MLPGFGRSTLSLCFYGNRGALFIKGNPPSYTFSVYYIWPNPEIESKVIHVLKILVKGVNSQSLYSTDSSCATGEGLGRCGTTEGERESWEAQRQKRDKLSNLMGQYLLKGYRMLGSTCSDCGVGEMVKEKLNVASVLSESLSTPLPILHCTRHLLICLTSTMLLT